VTHPVLRMRHHLVESHYLFARMLIGLAIGADSAIATAYIAE